MCKLSYSYFLRQKHIREWTLKQDFKKYCNDLYFTYLNYQRLILGLHRNSAKSAIWSDDHSGEGSAVSFLKLSSSKSSSSDSTVKESAGNKISKVNLKSNDETSLLLSACKARIKNRKHRESKYLCRICNQGCQWNPLCNLWKGVHLLLGLSSSSAAPNQNQRP